ncbi:aminotransferase class V-fold PLP-dependent enzyme [Mycoplasmopsis gallopavonis]|uniref:Probable cysteine desulfurase n=1 Tax=Mycoplasmopsis gallopavonis TaxID=76629 RepID=A0A449AZU7_9BACT|nr:aminotransferase class V-fold PLP-dependent enzyme [Mycoplasmopsis gallopavonis]RIV16906.1 aminotransferase class V-fold PLP-dependent enzyme [Mycoplasmopsis gallopavonis]VEU73014.1 Probable cysteine desulfurase [Mycoplasmopsis gallopavonis]
MKNNNQDIRDQFPILKNITYFDSAALVLKPLSAIEANTDFYLNKSISSRTADTPLGNEVALTIKKVRSKVADLIDAKEHEVIFTSGTTESLNNLAVMSKTLLQEGDEILLSAYNHSSNIIPWIEVAKQTNAKIVYAENLLEAINDKTKIIAFSHETNNFQQTLPFEQIIQKAKEKDIILVADAAQSIIHQKVSLQDFDAIVFSSNKFYGPTGMGVLAIKEKLIKQFRPAKFGGGSVTEIDTNSNWGLRDTITAFEPGTPHLAGYFMFNAAIDFFNSVGYQRTHAILNELSHYLHQKLKTLTNVNVLSKPGDFIAILNIKNIHPQDVATYLGTKNIYTRSGIFCAQYVRNIRDEYAYLRISLGIYNNFEDIDKLIEELANGGDFYAF